MALGEPSTAMIQATCCCPGCSDWGTRVLGPPASLGGVVGLGDVPARAWGWFGVCRGTLAYMLGSVTDRQLSPCRWAPARRAAAQYRSAQGGHPRPGDPWGARLQLCRPPAPWRAASGEKSPEWGRPRVLGAGRVAGGAQRQGLQRSGGDPSGGSERKGQGWSGCLAPGAGGQTPTLTPTSRTAPAPHASPPLLPQACPSHSSPTAPLP